MATPTTKDEFKDYCLRDLGHPVIEINVDADQLDDRVDEAIQKWQERHTDGSLKVFIKHQITQAEIDQEYVTIGDEYLEIIHVLPMPLGIFSGAFGLKRQFVFSHLFDLHGNISAGHSSGDFMIAYDQFRRHLSLIEDFFNNEKNIRFNRHDDKLYIDMNWSDNIKVDQFIVFEAIKKLDPDSTTEAWNDQWLKKYTTALIKRQWGQNLSKFTGVQLPGGITMNGVEIFQQANEDIQRLDDELRDTWEEPVNFSIG